MKVVIRLFGFKKKKEIILPQKLPVHIAIIMDGNGRWAKRRRLPRSAGHSAGSSTFKSIARYCNKIGIKYLTVYAFSTENWKRPKDEVDNILNILRSYLKDSKNFKHENIRLHFIGDLTKMPDDIVKLIDDAEQESSAATGLWVNIALNYGGRDELVYAAKLIANEVKNGKLDADAIDEQDISARLYTAGMPDPDLVIRPSGEYRLSNYLIWQTAYAELWFTDTLWPDFKAEHIDMAIKEYAERDRRFGSVK